MNRLCPNLAWTSCKLSNPRRISDHYQGWPFSWSPRSSARRSSNVRKLQNTWPLAGKSLACDFDMHDTPIRHPAKPSDPEGPPWEPRSRVLASIRSGSMPNTIRRETALTLLALVMVASGVLSALSANTGSTQSKSVAERVLHFPEERPLGQVYVRDATERDLPFREAVTGYLLDGLDGREWIPLGVAKGDVPVAPGQRVRLSVASEAWQDPSALIRLDADDVYEISLARTWADDQALAPLAHLVGLQSLNLSII